MELTLHISDELASRLHPVQDRLPQILELGLRELHAAPPHLEGLSEVLETLARLPAPQEILALRLSPAAQQHISMLVDKQREGTLSVDEERDWQKYQYLEHLVRIAKAKATLDLKSREAP